MQQVMWYIKWCTIGFLGGFVIGYGVTTWIIS